MEGDHKAPEAGQLPTPRPNVVEGKGVAKQRAAQRHSCRTIQNAIRNVLGRMTIGSAPRTLKFEELRVKQKAVLVAAKTRKSTTSLTRKDTTSSSVDIERTCVSKNFDETERLQSEKSGYEK